MSYILDALKKSESERKAEQHPTLYAQHGPIPGSRKRKKKKTFLYITSALFCVCIGSAATLKLLSIQTNPSEKLVANNPTRRFPEDDKNTVATHSPETTRPQLSTLPINANHTEENNIDFDDTHTTANEIQLKPPAPESSSEAPIQILDELPEDIRLSLPELHIAGHTYSNRPERRMIVINNRILREGDFIEQNLQLKEITWSGVVFTFNGIVFAVHND